MLLFNRQSTEDDHRSGVTVKIYMYILTKTWVDCVVWIPLNCPTLHLRHDWHWFHSGCLMTITGSNDNSWQIDFWTIGLLTLSFSQKLAGAKPAAVSKRSSGVTSIMNGSVGVLSFFILASCRPAHSAAKVYVLIKPLNVNNWARTVYVCDSNCDDRLRNRDAAKGSCMPARSLWQDRISSMWQVTRHFMSSQSTDGLFLRPQGLFFCRIILG